MNRNTLLIICSALFFVVVFSVVFFLPDSIGLFALIKTKVLSGEFYRLFTYSFAHLNTGHMVENIVGLLLVSVLIAEVKGTFKEYMFVYSSAAVLSVLPLWYVLQFTALGASNAIFALIGMALFGLRKFISMWVVLCILLILFLLKPLQVFFMVGMSSAFIEAVIQLFAHFSGFLMGIFLMLGIKKVGALRDARKSYVLRALDDC